MLAIGALHRETGTVEVITQNTDSLTAISSAHRIAVLVAVVVPLAGLVVAICGFWGWGFSWVELASMAIMYTLTGLGITVGYHRLFTHRSFETVLPVRVFLAVLGSMAVQGPLLRWVATHRRHHQHSDKPDDPHSPHGSGPGVLGVLSGWWHAHLGWMFKPDAPDLDRYVQDLRKERIIRFVSRLWVLWVALGLLIPAVIGGILTGTWLGVLTGFLWGGLVRVFLGHHVTWSINSVCHLWGTRTFQTPDYSRNNAIFGILAFGEGWHNNHHAFPTSARHGLRWWQLDSSYLVIRALEFLHLARRVRVPSRADITTKRRHLGPGFARESDSSE